jgi:hypothetical protein
VIEILKNSSKKILPQLKESNKKLSPDIKRWICLNDSYWNLEQERKKGTDEQDPVAGLFQSTIKYTKIAVTEGEKKSSSKKEISFVDLSAFSLYTAAKKLQQGKKELSDAYEKYAASCFLLAAIQQLAEGKKADLLNQLPVALRFSFKEGSVPKPTVLHYWEKVVDDNWKNIELLEAKHVGQI